MIFFGFNVIISWKKYYIFSNNSVSDVVQGLRGVLRGFIVTTSHLINEHN